MNKQTKITSYIYGSTYMDTDELEKICGNRRELEWHVANDSHYPATNLEAPGAIANFSAG
jgi:hypothetical protein